MRKKARRLYPRSTSLAGHTLRSRSIRRTTTNGKKHWERMVWLLKPRRHRRREIARSTSGTRRQRRRTDRTRLMAGATAPDRLVCVNRRLWLTYFRMMPTRSVAHDREAIFSAIILHRTLQASRPHQSLYGMARRSISCWHR
jgi:hypothetical protein